MWAWAASTLTLFHSKTFLLRHDASKSTKYDGLQFHQEKTPQTHIARVVKCGLDYPKFSVVRKQKWTRKHELHFTFCANEKNSENSTIPLIGAGQFTRLVNYYPINPLQYLFTSGHSDGWRNKPRTTVSLFLSRIHSKIEDKWITHQFTK